MQESFKRLAEGQQRAVESLERQVAFFGGLDAQQAASVALWMRRQRIVDLDPITGQATVKHGRYLDRQVLHTIRDHVAA